MCSWKSLIVYGIWHIVHQLLYCILIYMVFNIVHYSLFIIQYVFILYINICWITESREYSFCHWFQIVPLPRAVDVSWIDLYLPAKQVTLNGQSKRKRLSMENQTIGPFLFEWSRLGGVPCAENIILFLCLIAVSHSQGWHAIPTAAVGRSPWFLFHHSLLMSAE